MRNGFKVLLMVFESIQKLKMWKHPLRVKARFKKISMQKSLIFFRWEIGSIISAAVQAYCVCRQALSCLKRWTTLMLLTYANTKRSSDKQRGRVIITGHSGPDNSSPKPDQRLMITTSNTYAMISLSMTLIQHHNPADSGGLTTYLHN